MFASFLRTYRWPAILICLWVISLTGIRAIPVEDHELLVVQTTREMQIRGDWVLPSFNGEPRLEKPPFNYWATAAVSRLDPFSADIEILHGRLVSLLAGLVMVLATYHAGKKLYGPATGQMAALLLLGMQGYLNLAHSARPDFLYSTFCALQLFAWMHAWRAGDDTASQRWYGWLGWGMVGLATLTKGPQVPVVFLIGVVIFLLSGADRKRTLKVLRPFVGIPLACVIILPWWILLQQRLQILGVDIHKSQLSGSLLHNLASWQEMLSGYYLGTLFSLALPVGLILPFLLPRLWKIRKAMSDATRILLYASATLLIVFTVGGHYRKQYLIPLLPAVSLVLANTVLAGAYLGLGRLWKRILLALFAVLSAYGLWFIVQDGAYGSLALLLLGAIPVGLLLREELREPAWDPTGFSPQLVRAAAAMVILTTGYLAYLPTHMDRWRRAEQRMAESIGGTLQPRDLLVQWQMNDTFLPYFAKRTVPVFHAMKELESYYRSNSTAHTVYVVLPQTELPQLDATFQYQIVRTAQNPWHSEKDKVFLRLSSIRNLVP